MILFHINIMQEFNYYHAEFSKGEMVGPLNYYRTSRFRYDEEIGKENHGFLSNHCHLSVFARRSLHQSSSGFTLSFHLGH